MISVDKSWMQLDISTSECVSGVNNFLDYAFRHIKFKDKKDYVHALSVAIDID